MAGNLASRRILLVSSQSASGDQDGPPDLKRARSGALGAVRALQKEGLWPDNLDLLVISDAYGLAPILDPGEPPVPLPFTRTENSGWWDGFITRNLDNYITRRPYREAFVLVRAEHGAAVQASRKLRALDTTWAEPNSGALDELRAWLKATEGSDEPIPEEGPPPISITSTTPNLRVIPGGNDSDEHDRSMRFSSRSTGQLNDPDLRAAEPVPSQRIADLPAGVSGVIEASIYSARFMLVVSKLEVAQVEQTKRDLDTAWARRSARRHERPSVSNVILKRARLPWAERPATTLYSRILEGIGMASVLGSINKAVTQRAITEPGRYRDILARLPEDESEFISDVLYLLWEASSRMDKDEIAILRAYLSDTCTHTELRRMGLPRNLSIEDRYDLLHAVVQCISGLSPAESLSDHRRVLLLLDRVENLLGYPDHDRWELVKGLETLAAAAPPYLTLWLNLSPTSPATVAEIQAALESNLLITDDLTGDLAAQV